MALQQSGQYLGARPLSHRENTDRYCYRLVANLGHNASSRKLTRKAIENVNVPHACNTIEKPPGAPIALRLQGSLLYGVSGVYHKHGAYLLNDVEKVWACMRAYFREVKYSAGDTIDQNAGKAK